MLAGVWASTSKRVSVHNKTCWKDHLCKMITSNSTNHLKLYNHIKCNHFLDKSLPQLLLFNIQWVEYTGFMKPRIMLTLYTLISLIPLLLMSPQRVRTRTLVYPRIHTCTHAYTRVHSCTHVYTREHYYYYGLHWVTTGKETVVHEYKIK